jgi:hypothetical protein
MINLFGLKMARKKTADWFEKQKNPLTNRITWYWFVNPETPKSISLKLYPQYNYFVTKQKIRKAKPYVSSYISSHRDISNKVGYKDYTPQNYFSIIKKEGNLKYEKDKVYLNLNFLFDYLIRKGIHLSPSEKEMLKEFLNDWEIRKFLFEWNKTKNRELSCRYYNRKIDVFDFKRDLPDAIITFLRCIFSYEWEMLTRHIFEKEVIQEYIKIANIIENFVRPRHKKSGKLNQLLSKKRFFMINKIEDAYDRIPVLYKKIILTEKDKILEKKISNLIYGKPKKNK